MSQSALATVSDHFVTTKTAYGSLELQAETDGHDTKFQNPFATLWYLCTHSPAFKKLVSDSLTVHPNSIVNKWGIILYSDEFSQGNQLAYKHERKA